MREGKNKKQHAEGVWKSDQLNREKGSRGNCPLRSPEAAPLVGFGATPQLFRVKPTQRKKSTRCRQRSVPASNFARPQTRPQAADSTNCTVSRQMGATVLLVGKSKLVFIASRGFRLCGGESGALRSPPTPLRSAHPCSLTVIAGWENRNCPPSAPQSFLHADVPDSRIAPPAPGTAARRPSAPQTG